MKSKTQTKQNKNIERLKLPASIADIKSYSLLHDFVIVGDYEALRDMLIAFHPSAYMHINGIIYYEIACIVQNYPRKLYSPSEFAEKLMKRNKERKITNQTRLFVPWKCSLLLSSHGNSNKLHVMYIRRPNDNYEFEIYDFMERAGNKLDVFEYMENMMTRYNLPIPEFRDCINRYLDTKDKKPFEIYELKIKDDED